MYIFQILKSLLTLRSTDDYGRNRGALSGLSERKQAAYFTWSRLWRGQLSCVVDLAQQITDGGAGRTVLQVLCDEFTGLAQPVEFRTMDAVNEVFEPLTLNLRMSACVVVTVHILPLGCVTVCGNAHLFSYRH